MRFNFYPDSLIQNIFLDGLMAFTKRSDFVIMVERFTVLNCCLRNVNTNLKNKGISIFSAAPQNR